MRQNYQNFPKFCDLPVKIAPDLKVFVPKKIKNWASFRVKISIFLKQLGLWVTAHTFVKKIWGLWVRAMLKMVVLAALHTYHLRNESAPPYPTPGQFYVTSYDFDPDPYRPCLAIFLVIKVKGLIFTNTFSVEKVLSIKKNKKTKTKKQKKLVAVGLYVMTIL